MFGAWGFLFVFFFDEQRAAFTSISPVKGLRIKKNHEREEPIKRDDLTIKQKLSDTKLSLSRTHTHTRSPICLVPITHLHGARRMAHF